MRLAASLSMLFADRPFLERFAAAKAAGFEGVEILFPYDLPAKLLLDRLAALGLPLVLMNGPPPNYAGGPRGFAAVPGGEERFRSDFRRAARQAAALGAKHLHVMAGAAEGALARETYVRNLRWAANAAPSQSLLIEPMSPRAVPGYFLDGMDLARDVVEEVAAPNLRLQFDSFHAHLLTGDAARAFRQVRGLVGHVQLASPTRHEPEDARLLDQLATWDGWIGAEYEPRGRTEDGLGWARGRLKAPAKGAR